MEKRQNKRGKKSEGGREGRRKGKNEKGRKRKRDEEKKCNLNGKIVEFHSIFVKKFFQKQSKNIGERDIMKIISHNHVSLSLSLIK